MIKWKRGGNRTPFGVGTWISDCGVFTIVKSATHNAKGSRITRFPWALYEREQLYCCYGLLSEAKEAAFAILSPLEILARQA